MNNANNGKPNLTKKRQATYPPNKGVAFRFLFTFSAFLTQIQRVSLSLSRQENFKPLHKGNIMKLKALLSSLLVAGAVLGSSTAFASPSYHANTVNLGALEARIDSGVATGKLTRGEERMLRSELKSLRYTLKMALKDHRLTNKERNSLERKESSLKRNIYKLSNNRIVARGYGAHRNYNRYDDKHSSYQHDNPANTFVSISAVPNGSMIHVK